MPPDTYDFIPITSTKDITERASGRCSRRAIAAAVRRSWFAALAWAMLPPHHLMRLALLVRRDLAVMVEVGAVEMLEREAFRFLKRHATIVIGIRHLEQVASEASAHVIHSP